MRDTSNTPTTRGGRFRAAGITAVAATAAAVITMVGCDRQDTVAGRWYTAAQARQGAAVYRDNCAVCHGDQAQGPAGDWRQRLADGSFPPPPLNGTAHTWHHPLPVLMRVISHGGVPLGGKMPGFAATLDEAEMLSVIAWLQGHWSDEIYRHWLLRGGTGQSPAPPSGY